MHRRAVLLVMFSLALCLLAGAALFARDAETETPPVLGLNDVPLGEAALQNLVRNVPPTGRASARTWNAPYDLVLHETFRLASDPDLLILRDAVADPVKGFPVPKSFPFAQALPAEARAQIAALSRTRIQVVQFVRSVDTHTVASLRDAGFEPVAYLPNNAYLVRVPEGRDAELDARSDVRWRGELPWTFKFDPTLSAALTGGVGADSVLVQVAGYTGENPQHWEDLAMTLGATEVLYSRDHLGTPRMMLRVARAALRDVAAGMAQVPGVENIRLFNLPVLQNSGSVWLLQSGDDEIRSTPLFDAGLTGWGQIYAAVDSGLDTDGCQFRYDGSPESQTFAKDLSAPRVEVTNPDNKVIAYYVLTGAEAYDESSGGYHGTQTTGCAAGDNYANLATRTNPGLDYADGMAPAAKVVFQDASNKAGYLFGLAFETQYNISVQAYNSGARIHNNSYGTQDPSVYYDQDSQQLDDFSWEKNDYTIFFAAGNSGPQEQTLGGQGGTAKNTVAVGASMPGWYQGGKDMVYFSSRGPTSDLRLKPDVMAPGIIESATESGGESIPGKKNVYGQPVVVSRTKPGNNQCSVSMTTGTSFASPTAAGMGVLVRQYYADGFYPSGKANPDDAFSPTSALVRATMINSARNMTGSVIGFNSRGDTVTLGPIDAAPSTMQGWGLITLADALHLRGDRRDLVVFGDIPNGHADALATGDVVEHDVYVKQGMVLKVTLAWIDPAGAVGAGRVLVNDLDLEVVSPQGDLYLGNMAIEDGVSHSVDSGFARDGLNPQEQVIVASPAEGTWRVRVRAADVPGNGRIFPHDSTRQGYALIATGDLGEGQDELFPRVTARFDGVSGGCDADESLDPNEMVTITVSLLNSGDGESAPLRAVLSADAEASTLPVEWVVLPDEGVSETPRVPSRSRVSHTFQVGLGSVDVDVFDTTLALVLELFTQDGEWLTDLRFTIRVGIDIIEDGSVVAQRIECSPPATLTAVEPSQVFAGQNAFPLTLRGNHIRSGVTVTFVPDIITFDSMDVPDPTQIQLKRVQVSTDAEPGPVKIIIQNPDEIATEHDGLLEVFVPEPVEDGDEDEEVDETPVDDEPKVTSGCASLPSSGWFMLLVLLATGLLRRRLRA